MRQPRPLATRGAQRGPRACADAPRPRVCGVSAVAAGRGAQRGFEGELGRALQRGQFRLVYQPILRMPDGGPPQFEALLRWQHPRLGAVAPDSFIALAEDNGQILHIGDWVFRTAADECLRLRRASGQPVRIAVNVSPLQLASRSTLQLWVQYLQGIGLPAHALTLEITERVMTQRPDQVARHLRLLGDAGFRLALDDFGSGYSNLAMLGQFQLDTLKLDRSLTRCLAHSERHRTITTSIVEMAHQLRMKVVAEGVEGPAEATITSDLGCDYAQGYWYGMPLSSAQVAQRLADAA